jgi:uncharacterized protein YciW
MTTNTTTNAANLTVGTPADCAVQDRANIFRMTQDAENAVLRPVDAGVWPHDLRAALAARIAHLNDEGDLAEKYAAGAGDYAVLAHPKADGAAQGLAPILAFMDKVTVDTRNVDASDISGLKSASVSDADIVRLCELNAFLAYQIRVIAGLRLMREMPA